MNKKYKYLILFLVFILCFAQTSNAGNLKKIAQTGMKWLSIPIGGRASALGGAYTAMANDASSIFWNPAGIAMTEGGHAFLTQTRWIADINVNAGALTYSLKNWGVVGVSFASVEWGTFHGTRRANNDQGYIETGEFSPTNWSAGVAYARRVSDKFSFGGHLKYLYEKLGTNMEGSIATPGEYTAEMNLLAFDFGTVYYTGYKDLRFAMSLQNFSQEKKYRAEHFPLPLTFRFGLAMDLTRFVMPESNHSLILAVDAIHPRDYSERMHLGLEYGFKNLVFLRGGYKTNYDEEDFSFGAGFHYALGGIALTLDYSYLQFQHFDAVNMFSFDFEF